jgi:DNA-binding NtrC family response regulator
VSTPTKLIRRILLVDDETRVTTALRRALRNEGYELVECNDPVAGLALMKVQKFDMVISDHLMPNMTGMQFSKLVRDRYPDTLRLMLTGQPDVNMMMEAINHAEVYRFITKPWNDLELKVIISLAFEQLDQQRERSRLHSLVERWAATS